MNTNNDIITIPKDSFDKLLKDLFSLKDMINNLPTNDDGTCKFLPITNSCVNCPLVFEPDPFQGYKQRTPCEIKDYNEIMSSIVENSFKDNYVDNFKPDDDLSKQNFSFAKEDFIGHINANNTNMKPSYKFLAVFINNEPIEALRHFMYTKFESINADLVVFGTKETEFEFYLDEDYYAGLKNTIKNTIFFDVFDTIIKEMGYVELKDVYENRTVYIRNIYDTNEKKGE